MNIRDYQPTGPAMDLSDTVTAQCPCGCNLFRTVVSFDEESYELAAYSLDGTCLDCGTHVKLPTPLDKE